jgi:nicotinamidase-related amidase
MSNMHSFLRGGAAAAAVIILTFAACASAADILDDWAKVELPPAPGLKDVTLDGPTTAVIIMDMNQHACAANPRCAATVPAIKRIHDAGRAAGAMFWYSLPGADSKPSEMIAPGFTPKDDEWERIQPPDKFFESHLAEKLKAHNIQAAIICGHSFEGAGIATGQGLANRGYKVIVPVDCNASSGPNALYLEQYAAWNLAKSQNGVANHVTLTRSTMIKFSSGGSARSAQKAPAGGE